MQIYANSYRTIEHSLSCKQVFGKQVASVYKLTSSELNHLTILGDQKKARTEATTTTNSYYNTSSARSVSRIKLYFLDLEYFWYFLDLENL